MQINEELSCRMLQTVGTPIKESIVTKCVKNLEILQTPKYLMSELWKKPVEFISHPKPEQEMN